jgi:hypothetical protein
MNKRELSRDLLNDGNAEFEQAVFRKTLGAARRTRRLRIAGRCAAIALLASLVLFQLKPRRQVEIVQAPEEAPELVSAHTPLKTRPFEGTIRTEPFGTPQALAVDSESFALLKTGEAEPGNLQLINDDQLLSFFAGRAVALVHRGPHNAELVFLQEEPKE